MHRWKKIINVTEELRQLLREEPLLNPIFNGEGLVNNVEAWRKMIPFLRKRKIHGLLELAQTIVMDSHRFWDDEDKPVLNLWFPWESQIKARKIYGGCFPSSWRRMTFVRDNKVVRLLEIQGTSKHTLMTVKLRFTRQAIEGEVVDGCKVVRTTSYDYGYRMPEMGTKLVSLCPTR